MSTDTIETAKAAYYQRLQGIAAIANAPCLSSVEAGRALQKIADLCSRELRGLDFVPRKVELEIIETGAGDEAPT